MYLNKLFNNNFARRQNSLQIIYASKGLANIMVNLDADLSDIPAGVLEDKLSIPETQIYQNEIATLKEHIMFPPNTSLIEPLAGNPGVPLKIKVDALRRISPSDLMDDVVLEEKIKGLFNVYIDGYTVLIYPKDSLASIISKVRKKDLALFIYLTLARALGDPEIVKHFHRQFRNKVVMGLLTRSLRAS